MPDLFRSFLPLLNPIGFGASDFLEFALAATVLLVVWQRSRLERALGWLAARPWAAMILLAVLPVGLRLALLAHHPVPVPEIYDEFSHLLVADTLRHWRLANPPHPLSQFFETFFVLQQPTYSSIYPVGQGLAMAVGRALFGLPWAGVLLTTGAFCALVYWMLLGWVPPVWALVGGLLAVMEFGPLSQWMNSYWGGSLAAMAGCLVFGALPRVAEKGRVRDGVLLGLGLAVHALTRPYESVFLLAAIALFLAPRPRWALLRPLLAAGVPLLLAGAVTLLQNRSVTGSWTTLPYSLSQYQYGVPAALTFQAKVTPHRVLTPQQELGYKMQDAFQGVRETPRTYLARLGYRVRFYRFYFLAPLYLALAWFLLALRERRFVWVAFTGGLLALGTNFFPAFQYHYLGGIVCLFLLMSVEGLRRMRRDVALFVLVLCGFHFAFWYAMHLFEETGVSLAMRRFETWDVINHDGPSPRTLVRDQLAGTSGKQLVFVRYWPGHVFQEEWVYNDADIDGSRVVLARDLGPVENQKLRDYYRDRAVLLLEPDARPPKLSSFPEEEKPKPPEPVITAAPPAIQSKRDVEQPTLRFEQVK